MPFAEKEFIKNAEKTDFKCVCGDGGEWSQRLSDEIRKYGSNSCHAYEGRAVAIVRTNKPGQVKITVIANDLAAGSGCVQAV